MRFITAIVVLFFVGLATAVALHQAHGPLAAMGFCIAVAGVAAIVAGLSGVSPQTRTSSEWDDWPRRDDARDHDVGVLHRPVGETRWVSDTPDSNDNW
jgi:hypothetical protein